MKPYTPNETNSYSVIRYAVMSASASALCSSVVLGHIDQYVSLDRRALLIVLFNVVAIMTRPLFSVFADRVTNKHTGVRLGVMLMVLGLYYPITFGINTKVTITALGCGIFHSFASSILLCRSDGKSLPAGLYIAGGALGLAFTTFSHFFGYVMAALLMMFAIAPDNPPKVCNSPDDVKPSPFTAFGGILLLFVSYTLVSFFISSLHFPWNDFFKDQCLIYLSLALGRVLGGLISDFIGRSLTVIAGIGGGAMFILCCSQNKLLSLIGLILISCSLAPTVTLSCKYLKAYPGFSFSLLSVAAYLGQTLNVFVKIKEVTLPIVCIAAVVFFLSANFTFFFQSSEEKESENDV